MAGQADRRSQKGAVVIHVALALLALLAFTVFVIDYGLMWVSRRQAQNAADAGALAGAISLLYDMTNSAGAEASARSFARRNVIWGEETADPHIIVPTPPIPCPSDGVPACIRVDVFRGVRDRALTPHPNTLPTFMGHILGINSQGVRATATAQVGAGNAVNCIKPWIVADKWIDHSGTGIDPTGWDQMDTFDPAVDTYVRPGFTADGDDNDIGVQLMLKGDGHEWSAGWSMRIELGGGNGSAAYMDEIQGCPSWVPEVGIYDGSVPCESRPDQDFEKGCINVRPGVAQGPTVQHGVNHLVGLDSEAYWDEETNSVAGGCTDAGTCASVDPEGKAYSPRIIPLALFNPARCATTGCQTGNNTVAEVVNIMGFFLEGTCSDVFTSQNMPPWCGSGGEPGKTIVGRIVNYPGLASGGTGSAGPWSFIKVVRLIR